MYILRIALCLLLATPFALFAQEDTQEHETLLSGNIIHGGYGGPVFKVSSIQGSAEILTGGYGGWLINHTFMIGLGGYGIATKVTADETAPKVDGKAPNIELGYGGLALEYIIAPEKLIHFTVHSIIGAGGAGYSISIVPDNTSQQTTTSSSTAFFAAEVGVNAQLNIASFCRLSIGGSYRFVSGASLLGITNKDLSGPSGNIALLFGKF